MFYNYNWWILWCREPWLNSVSVQICSKPPRKFNSSFRLPWVRACLYKCIHRFTFSCTHEVVPEKELTLVLLWEKGRMLQAAGKMEGHHRALQSAGGGANAQFGFCCGRWTHCRDPKAHVEFVESPGGVVETLCRRHAVKAKQAGGLFIICFSLGFLRVFLFLLMKKLTGSAYFRWKFGLWDLKISSNI